MFQNLGILNACWRKMFSLWSEAKIGSEPFKAIEAVLKLSSKSDSFVIEEPISKQDFSNDYKKLSSNGASYEQSVKRIDKDINDELKKITELENEENEILESKWDWNRKQTRVTASFCTIKLEEAKISLLLSKIMRGRREKKILSLKILKLKLIWMKRK